MNKFSLSSKMSYQKLEFRPIWTTDLNNLFSKIQKESFSKVLPCKNGFIGNLQCS